MSELKPVDCLPKITAEERQFLHYNPNTQDVVDWVVGYALASIDEWNRRAQPAAPAERTPTDYALEFAEYMAKGAEGFIEAVCKLALLQQQYDDGEGPDPLTMQDAEEGVSEYMRGLRSDIFEFRKRRDRAATVKDSLTPDAAPSVAPIPAPACECAACKPNTIEEQRMILCSICGNKRCPHATDHRHACTNSNEYGQPGSVFGGIALADAVPSVAPEPVAWTLQSELDAAQTTCSAHLWFTNPRNSAWTALFTREQIAAHPPRAPLTEEFWLMLDTALDALKYHQEQTRPIELTRVTIAAVETFISAHGIGGK